MNELLIPYNPPRLKSVLPFLRETKCGLFWLVPGTFTLMGKNNKKEGRKYGSTKTN